MQLKEVEKILNKFAKYVIKQARTNLTKTKKNSTKKLYKSIDYRVNKYKDSIDLLFNMEDYAAFQDLKTNKACIMIMYILTYIDNVCMHVCPLESTKRVCVKSSRHSCRP